MRDFEKLVKKLRYCSKPGNCNLQCPRFSFAEDCLGKLTKNAADAIEELLDQRDKALKRLCEFCGICSEKSRTPLECEVAGFVVEPPKGVE